MVPPFSDRVSRAPPYSISQYTALRIRGYHPLWPTFPSCSSKPYTAFGLVPLSLVATNGISVDFFSSGYLDISVHQVRFVHLCIQCTILLAQWVPPFGHCRINACCQLPDTFRRLPRPSSPLIAKASTVCASSLDHITSSRLSALECFYVLFITF